MALAAAVVAALLAGLVVAGDAQTQDARLEAAKKEGKVVWYTSLVLPSAERVAKLFEAAYPGVKVEVHRTGSQRILQRVMQELQAKIKNVDVVHTSDAGHYVLEDAGEEIDMERYDVLSSIRMNAMGLIRYWKKRAEREAAELAQVPIALDPPQAPS